MIIDPVDASSSPEVQMNEGFETLEFGAVYGKRPSLTTGLNWSTYGGRWGGFQIAAEDFTMTNGATNYFVVNRSTGVQSRSTSSTNWDNVDDYARVYKVTTAGGLVTAEEDHRAGPNGIHAGIPREKVPLTWRTVSDDSPQQDTLVLGDAENGVRYDYSSGEGGGLCIVPTNASVAFPLGTSILLQQRGSGKVTVSPVSGTVTINVRSAFLKRSAGQYALLTLVKDDTNVWVLSGDLEAV